MRHRLVIAVAAMVLAATACGAGPSTEPDQEMTARALAGAVVHHVGKTPRSAAPTFPSQRLGALEGAVNALVTFPYDDPDRRLDLSVSVLRRSTTGLTCRPSPGKGDGIGGGLEYADNLDGCVTGTRDGRTYRVVWQDEEPEEDPGIVTITARTDDAVVVVGVSGPTIHGDPRSGDLERLTRRLVALATDPAVGLRTSKEYVEDGDAISDKVWRKWARAPGEIDVKPKELGGPG